MPFIALKQTVIYEKLIGTDPDYGDPIYAPPVSLRCRFQEGTKLVRNQRGDEVVSVGTFFFDRLAGVYPGDLLTYTDEMQRTVKYTVLARSVKRMYGGKPVLTEVSV